MTSYAPISSKIKFSQNEGIKQSRNRKQCASRQRMDERAKMLRMMNETTFCSNIILVGSDFHTVGAATEKALVPVFVFT